MEGQSTRLWSVLRRMLAGILPGVGSAAETYHTPEHCMHIDNGDKQQDCMDPRSCPAIGGLCRGEEKEDVPREAQAPQDSEQSGELQDLSLPDMHASEQPSKTGSSAVPCLNAHGFNSYAASSPQDAAVHDVNTSHVGGNSDRDVYYDAVNMLSPWETLAAQDFWDNLETEASEDNPWDDAASSECPTITTCDSAMCLTCHMCSAPCACQVCATQATGHALAATKYGHHSRLAAVHAGLLPTGAHLAPQHPKNPGAGFSSRNGTSPQDTASRDAENSTVGGDQDCEVFYDAVSILAPWETLAAQEFWDNLETEPSSDNPWTGAASSTRDSKHVTFCLTQPTRRRRSPPQKPSLIKRAKWSLKRLRDAGVRISFGIQRCAAAPKVKDYSAEEHVRTPKDGPKVKTAAQAIISVTC